MSKEGPRHIETIGPEETGPYLAVPGWRIWVRNIFDKLEFRVASEEAGSKELALASNQFGKGYRQISGKLDAVERALHPNRPSSLLFANGTDQPWYLLEPLTEEEVARIDEQGEMPGPVGSIDRPSELLRPSELREIFAEVSHKSGILRMGIFSFNPENFYP